jgi:hypothetical protein
MLLPITIENLEWLARTPVKHKPKEISYASSISLNDPPIGEVKFGKHSHGCYSVDISVGHNVLAECPQIFGQPKELWLIAYTQGLQPL